MRRSTFYSVIAGLIILNGYLLSKPNLLGKIGLIVYQYYYLRTFPRTLLTATIVCAIAILLTELFTLLVRRRTMGTVVAGIMFGLLVVLSFAQLVKTGVDFSTWTYSHTGLRFRLGAFVLPTVVIFIFTYGWMRLPRRSELLVQDDNTQGHRSTRNAIEHTPITKSPNQQITK
jgi:Na+/proline symporter